MAVAAVKLYMTGSSSEAVAAAAAMKLRMIGSSCEAVAAAAAAHVLVRDGIRSCYNTNTM